MTKDDIESCIIVNTGFCSSKFRSIKKKKGITLTPLEAFLIYHEIEHPSCYCGKPTKFKSFNVGFQTHCCAKCSNKSKEKIEKSISTHKNRSEEDKEKTRIKIKQTFEMKTTEEKELIKLKYKKSIENKSEEEKELTKKKRKETCLIKYGFDNHMKNKEISNKSVQTQIELYGGCFNPKKVKETNLSKYGVEHPISTQEVKNKLSKTLRKFYNGTKSKLEGTVYFLELNDLIKIGVSSKNNFKKRYNILCRNYDAKLNIIKLIETDDIYKLEKYYHELFNDYNVILPDGEGKTEWFSNEIIAMINS